MLWALSLIGLGLIGLWLGSDLMVSCSAKVAWRARFPALLTGLTIVSIGTSVPEISVSVTGALDIISGLETSGVVIGDNIGSFICQLLLILGIVGFSNTIVVPERSVKRDGPMLLISLAVFYIVCIDQVISRVDGYLLVAVYLGYNVYVFLKERKGETDIGEKTRTGMCWREQHPLLDLVYLIIGLSLVILASAFVVDQAINLATFLNIDQFLIGIVLVGVGTSMPELVVSLQSARKGESDISIGNVVGSNVTDLLFATAVGAIVAQNLHVGPSILFFDLPFAFIASSLFLLLARRRLKVDRSVSLILLMVFGSYVALKIMGM